jgi:DnaJ family protein C protein 17
VKWPKESTFNDKLLRLIFKVYGPIKEIVVLAQKRKAVVEYHTTEAANNAIANETSPELKVRFLMKGDKRTKLQAFLCQSRESLEKRDEEQVFSLSTDTLKRITHFYNKDSKIFVNDQKELLKRDEERRRMMEQILQEELMN